MKKEASKALWKICFDDTNEFIERYFQQKCSEETSLVRYENSEAVAALQLIPYTMTYGKEIFPIGYISGACTHPDHRGKGVMKALLAESFGRLYEERAFFATLIPGEEWLFDYYQTMGFEKVFKKVEVNLISSPTPQSGIVLNKINSYSPELYRYIDRKLSEHACAILHTESDYQAVFEDLSLAGGTVYLALDEKGQLKGVAVVLIEQEKIRLVECLTDSVAVERFLIAKMKKLHPTGRLDANMLSQDHIATKPFGMARIIRVKEVLEAYARLFPDTTKRLKLTDQVITQNSGYYELLDGICRFSTTPFSKEYEEIHLPQLTELVLAPLKPHMSLMME